MCVWPAMHRAHLPFLITLLNAWRFMILKFGHKLIMNLTIQFNIRVKIRAEREQRNFLKQNYSLANPSNSFISEFSNMNINEILNYFYS
ncbi:hypothetical protein R3W88_028504 [Solanum pinnatisectum]|uniref:Uncharacterized protein n=1 Tax=Solanum pinnatisectum TaxID=50273 RepID=A0AAV9K2M3_9SOLN|nr:hypothetical protein R3W88_028504 [Solanum pinnatisectum]